MIKTIIRIRLLQIYRLLSDIGWLRIVFILFMLGLIGIITYTSIKNSENNLIVLLSYGLLILSTHISRKDKKFLNFIASNPYKIYFSEYILLTLPLIILCLLTWNLTIIAISTLLCIAIPAFPFVKNLISPFSGFGAIPGLINIRGLTKKSIKIPISSPYAFEWISGIRQLFAILIPLYILVLSFSFRGYVGPIGMIILSVIISGFYSYGEPREFIELYATTSNEFLIRKMIINFKLLYITLLPIALVSIISQPEIWYWTAGALIIAGLIQILSVVFKYGLFRENSDLSRNGMILFLNIVFILIPFFWPAPVFMGIRYYIKAKNNLKQYFNDNNS